MRATLLITAKDLRQRVRDRSAFIFGVIAPLGLAVIFNLVFGNLDQGQLNLRFGVVDADGGAVAAGFVDGALPALEQQGLAAITTFDDDETARQATSDGEVDAVFLIPADFGQRVAGGQGATISVFASADATIATDVAMGVARSYAARIGSIQLAATLGATREAGSASPQAAAAAAERAQAIDDPVTLGAITTDRRQLDSTTYLAAGMAVFFLFFTVQFGVAGLLEERRDGTLDRLLAAPISRWAVVGGKAMTSFVLGMVSMAVLVIASSVLLGASFGNPVGVGILIVAGVLAALGIMSVVATVARTAEQANVWQSIIAVVLGMLGGTFFPLAGEGWLANLSLLTPHAWFLRGLAKLADAGPLSGIVVPTLAMLAFAVVATGVAAARISRGEVLR